MHVEVYAQKRSEHMSIICIRCNHHIAFDTPTPFVLTNGVGLVSLVCYYDSCYHTNKVCLVLGDCSLGED